VLRVEYALLPLAGEVADVDLLDDAERARAARFVSVVARSRFVQVRAALRAELAHRLGAAPRGLHFTYGRSGKPALAPPFDRSRLEFSVAHSHDLALLAFADTVALGVDLERVRALRDADGLAGRVLSEQERAQLARLSGAAWTEAFFRLWTRKEALVKCFGGSLLGSPPSGEAVGFAEVPVPAGYVAAVCTAEVEPSLVERPLYSAG
jgi:4'-phosphopantetheinyl transferase